jgi:hypothetical protein
MSHEGICCGHILFVGKHPPSVLLMPGAGPADASGKPTQSVGGGPCLFQQLLHQLKHAQLPSGQGVLALLLTLLLVLLH